MRKDVRAERLFSIEVQRPMALLEGISVPVRNLISIAKATENVGLSNDEAKHVNALVLDIETTLSLLEAYIQEDYGGKTVKAKINEMRNYISEFSTHATMQTLEQDQLSKHPERLRRYYVELSNRILEYATGRIQGGVFE